MPFQSNANLNHGPRNSTPNILSSAPARKELTMDQALYLVILVVLFVGIVAWVFARKRKARFERDAKIPFQDKDG